MEQFKNGSKFLIFVLCQYDGLGCVSQVYVLKHRHPVPLNVTAFGD